MKYLFVLPHFSKDIRVYYVKDFDQDTLNAVIDLVVHKHSVPSFIEDELIDRMDSHNKVISNGKVLKITREHPYALCNDFEVKE